MKKKIIISMVVLVILLSGVFIFFFQIWNEENRLEEKMKAEALSKVSKLKTIEDIDKFTGENEYYFIFGKNSLEWDVLVWINEEEVHSKYLYDWFSKEEILKEAELKNPNITIKRITAGINPENVLIYEILYEDNEGKLGYIYYDLLSGELLKMYRLGKIE